MLFNIVNFRVLMLLTYVILPMQCFAFGTVLGTDIHGAARKGDLKKIKKMIQSEVVEVDKVEANGNTALHFAAWKQRAKVVDFLILSGADVNRQDKQGQTALMNAAAYDCRKCTESLLAANADTETTDGAGRTALAYAVKSGHLRTVKTLIAVGANTRAIDYAGVSMLDYAQALEGKAKRHQSQIIDLLNGPTDSSQASTPASNTNVDATAKSSHASEDSSQHRCKENDNLALDKNENKVLRYLIRQRFSHYGLGTPESLCVESIVIKQRIALAGDSIVQFSSTIMFPQGYKTHCIDSDSNISDCTANSGLNPQEPGARANYEGEEAL